MLRADLPAVMAIEVQANPVPWKAEDFEAFLQEPGRPSDRQGVSAGDPLLAQGAGGHMGWVWAGPEVQGFACAMGAADEAELQSIAVARDRWGRGIGLALMISLSAWAEINGYRRLHLEVRERNARALDFYRRWGFTVTGRRPKYYRDNLEDALLMTKTM